jgi:hypothetical protein
VAGRYNEGNNLWVFKRRGFSVIAEKLLARKLCRFAVSYLVGTNSERKCHINSSVINFVFSTVAYQVTQITSRRRKLLIPSLVVLLLSN